VPEAFDRAPLYFPANEKSRILFCSAARNRPKLFTSELSELHYFIAEGENRPAREGEGNVLEDAEDRRSAGWHGNQHVCLRSPQISDCDSSAFRRR
jgi:hypothetical protein